MRFVMVLGISLLSTVMVLAQTECPLPERAAVAESRVWCADLADGQVCYGNSPVIVETASAGDFRVAGDRLPAGSVGSLTTVREESAFGVSLIQTHTYSADSWVAQPLTLAVMGNTIVNNRANENITVPVATGMVTSVQGANIRSGASPEYRILTSLLVNETVQLTGITADGGWLRAQLPDGETGWVVADAVTTDTAILPIVSQDDPAPAWLFAPFASLGLQTATGDAPCVDAPESGLLVQTTADEPVRLQVNDVLVAFDGTLFLQTTPETFIIIHVLEGRAQVDDQIAEAGFSLSMLITGEARVTAYDIARLAPVPVEMMPRYVYVGIDLSTIITPAPDKGGSPIAGVLVNAPCVITTGESGSYLRAGAGAEFERRGVLNYRETARPIGRAVGSDGSVWWELAQNVWISGATTVTGGDCVSVPQSERIPVLPVTPQAND